MYTRRIPRLYSDFLRDTYYETLEDPIHAGFMEKTMFIDIYRQILETFDGTDMASYIDFYFTADITHTTHLRFIDEDSKMDFYDFAVELGIMPSLKEVQEGENNEDKTIRKNKEQVEQEKREYEEKFGRKMGQTKKSTSKHIVEKAEKEARILEQKRATLVALQQKLDLETDISKILALKKKIQKIGASI